MKFQIEIMYHKTTFLLKKNTIKMVNQIFNSSQTIFSNDEEAIQKMPLLSDNGSQHFLSMLYYLDSFITHLYSEAQCLSDLMKGNAEL